MRNISFALTTAQVRAGTKDVTRRLGWSFLKPGDHLMAVEKCQGLKKGEGIKRIREIEIISFTAEPLNAIFYQPIRDGRRSEVDREGFPEMTLMEFVKFFCKSMKIEQTATVHRIEFRYVGECVPSLVPEVTA